MWVVGPMGDTSPAVGGAPRPAMLTPVLRLSVRSAMAHWRRFVLTTVAVVVGVSFVVGSFVLTDSLSASINHLLHDATTRTDFVVGGGGGRGARGAGLGIGGGGGGRGGRGASTVPVALVSEVQHVAGVGAVDPVVTGVAALLDKAGQAKAFDVTAVSNWPKHPDMSAVHLVSGRAPAGSGDVVIDTATAADRQLSIGSRIRIATTRGVVSERVSGLAERGTGDLGLAGQIIDVTLARATHLVGTDGYVGAILVQVAPGANRDAVQSALSATVGPDQSVLSAETLLADARARIQDRLKSFNGLMLGFAAVTLFVSGFLIWNTFSTVVAQRTRELALLRAVGASREQIFGSVFGEGALVGLTSSIIGIGVGVAVAIGLRALLGVFGFDLPSAGVVLAPRSVAVGLGVGLGVTVVSVLGPAWRSTSIAPVAAMAAAALPPSRGSRRRLVIGLVLIALGLVLGAHGLRSTNLGETPRLKSIGLGGALTFLGIAAVARFMAGPVIRVLGAPFRRFGGVAAALARRNAIRDPRRTASTALALMIGMALVATTLVLGQSVKTAFGGALRASITAQVVVSASGLSPIDPSTSRAIARAPGVSSAVSIESARARLAGNGFGGGNGSDGSGSDNGGRGRIGVSTGDVTAIESVVRPGFLTGGYPTDDHHIAISKSFADDQHLGVGDPLVIESDSPPRAEGAPPAERTLRVSGVYERDELLDDSVARPGALAGIDSEDAVTKLVLVTTSDDPATVARRLARVAASIPNSAAQTTDDYVSSQTDSFDVVLGIVDVLLFFAVLVAGLGIANTLALAVVERTREIGLLRAVGMDRRAVRRMIRIEGVLVAFFGGVLGVGFGIAFGAIVSAALPVDTARLTLPSLRLVALFAAAGVLGIIAAALPARRAAGLDVLEAIAAP